jgi:hypothetical protein
MDSDQAICPDATDRHASPLESDHYIDVKTLSINILALQLRIDFGQNQRNTARVLRRAPNQSAPGVWRI